MALRLSGSVAPALFAVLALALFPRLCPSLSESPSVSLSPAAPLLSPTARTNVNQLPRLARSLLDRKQITCKHARERNGKVRERGDRRHVDTGESQTGQDKHAEAGKNRERERAPRQDREATVRHKGTGVRDHHKKDPQRDYERTEAERAGESKQETEKGRQSGTRGQRQREGERASER